MKHSATSHKLTPTFDELCGSSHQSEIFYSIYSKRNFDGTALKDQFIIGSKILEILQFSKSKAEKTLGVRGIDPRINEIVTELKRTTDRSKHEVVIQRNWKIIIDVFVAVDSDFVAISEMAEGGFRILNDAVQKMDQDSRQDMKILAIQKNARSKVMMINKLKFERDLAENKKRHEATEEEARKIMEEIAPLEMEKSTLSKSLSDLESKRTDLGGQISVITVRRASTKDGSAGAKKVQKQDSKEIVALEKQIEVINKDIEQGKLKLSRLAANISRLDIKKLSAFTIVGSIADEKSRIVQNYITCYCSARQKWLESDDDNPNIPRNCEMIDLKGVSLNGVDLSRAPISLREIATADEREIALLKGVDRVIKDIVLLVKEKSGQGFDVIASMLANVDAIDSIMAMRECSEEIKSLQAMLKGKHRIVVSIGDGPPVEQEDRAAQEYRLEDGQRGEEGRLQVGAVAVEEEDVEGGAEVAERSEWGPGEIGSGSFDDTASYLPGPLPPKHLGGFSYFSTDTYSSGPPPLPPRARNLVPVSGSASASSSSEPSISPGSSSSSSTSVQVSTSSSNLDGGGEDKGGEPSSSTAAASALPSTRPANARAQSVSRRPDNWWIMQGR